ncbi:ABC transporter ATP-binding protein [Glaciibacter psychrotolerans]|uniref:ABC-type branched-subunit amino acid transport system ATPase component n=1 Tax=Glaciibacter psychrotolerans TaxID=670054 RepID=A0A7Z0J701_9MICO|nr:ABC transporter ATP-binding protein [Leifsonia psychrotolerans]NYJ20419.1 ABC-type branched-subunit amino acid transport system ATPase component [Leifsonia psychrotolerans]
MQGQHFSATTPAAGISGSGLRAEGVSVSFSGIKALTEVDFRITTGEVVGLIGPNGSGKTTLLNVLSGVYRPSSGRTFVNEIETTSLRAHRIARLGVARTFQNIRLFGNMTVLQNVQVGSALSDARPRGAELRDAALKTLDELGLNEFQERRAGTLPYGIRRRIEIARALATKPKFLLLDEPAAGANGAESEELSELIEMIASHYSLGVLVIEHDLRLMMRVASRIVALTGGRVIAEGDAEGISQNQAVREAYFGKKWAAESFAEPSLTTESMLEETK